MVMIRLFAFCLSYGLLLHPAWAEDSVPYTLETIVITASRADETNHESPYVVERVGEETLIERSIRSVPEAFEWTPGVIVQKTSHGQGSPLVRGFTGYHNLFLIDGIRLNNASFRSGPNQYWNTVDSQGLRAIELVKSQGSVLYGSDSVGGSVQALTRRPDYAESGSHFGGRSFSRYSTGEQSFLQRAEFSLSETDQYGLILGGTWKDFGNIRAADLGTLPKTGYDEWDVDIKLELFPSEDTRLTLFHQQVHIDDAWRVHKTRFAKSFEGTDIGNERSRSLDQDRMLNYLQWEGAGYGRLFDHYTLSLSYQEQKEERTRERSDRRVDVQGFDLDSFGAWLQFEKALPSTDLTYGASYYQDRVDSYRNDFNADGSFKGSKIQGPLGDDGTYDLISAFVNTSTLVGDRLRLDLGGRYTFAAADIDKVEDPATGKQIGIDENWSNVVASGRISYQLDESDTMRLFGGLSQAFRAPNFSDLSRLDANRSNEIETPAPGLDPEHFLTSEIGVKIQTDRASASLSYYYTRVDDLILRTPTGRIVDGLEEVTKLNSGDGHVQGVDVSGSLLLADGLTAFGGFAYQDSRVSTFPTSDPVLVDEPLSRLMPTNGHVGLRWDSADERFWVEGLVSIFADGDRLSTRDRRDTQRIPPGGTPGYAVASLRSGWRPCEGLHLTAGVNNLLDEAYRAHGSGQNEPGIDFVIGAEIRF